jgi:hypothetical protein
MVVSCFRIYKPLEQSLNCWGTGIQRHHDVIGHYFLKGLRPIRAGIEVGRLSFLVSVTPSIAWQADTDLSEQEWICNDLSIRRLWIIQVALKKWHPQPLHGLRYEKSD